CRADRCRHIVHIRASRAARRLLVGALERATPPNNLARQEWRARGGTMKIWLTVAEGADYAGVSRDTIYTACERRELQHARVGGRRAIRVKRDWIDAWLEQHARGTQHAHPDATTPLTSQVEHARRTTVTSRSDGRS